jgi:peptidyl-dipeptidase A
LTLSLICSQKQFIGKFLFKNVFTLCTFFTCSAMLEIGKKKPWPYALEKMTGSKEMSVAPMKEYFQPLQEWLVKERCSKKYEIGWPGQPADGVDVCATPAAPIKSTTESEPNSANAAPSCLLALFYLIGLFQAVTWM